MTQKNIDIMDSIVEKMKAGKKLSAALKDVYGKRNVAIPYDEEMLNIDITKLGMSMRTTNALRRGGMKTLADVVSYCEKQKITALKTVGASSGIELFETMLDYLWDKMPFDDRVQFLINTVERNEINLL